jgi:hypothetical protein
VPTEDTSSHDRRIEHGDRETKRELTWPVVFGAAVTVKFATGTRLR